MPLPSSHTPPKTPFSPRLTMPCRCCVVEWLLSLGCFERLRHSKPLRLQLLAIGCAVGVSSTFGAPIGGVLFSIEVTATYFYIPIYWKCFFTAVVGAVLSRLLYSWYHLDADHQVMMPPPAPPEPRAPLRGATSPLHSRGVPPTLRLPSLVSSRLQLGIDSMLHTDDISTDPKDLLAYVLIGLICGAVGSLFVRLNAQWMAFR